MAETEKAQSVKRQVITQSGAGPALKLQCVLLKGHESGGLSASAAERAIRSAEA